LPLKFGTAEPVPETRRIKARLIVGDGALIVQLRAELCAWRCVITFRASHVDDEPLLHVALQHFLVAFVDLLDPDQLDVACDPAFGAEIEHLLRLGEARAPQTFPLVTGHAPLATLALLLLGSRGWKIGIPDISPALPLGVRLLFPNLAILAAILRAIVHGQFIRAG